MIMNPRPCPNLPLPSPPINVFGTQKPLLDTPSIRRRSSTFTSIANWALAVQPGSPAPYSPLCVSPTTGTGFTFTSTPRRPSFTFSKTRRRSSVSRPDGLNIVNEDLKSKDWDLTCLGYTSMFVPLPNTPRTPVHLSRRYYGDIALSPKHPEPPAAPVEPPKAKGLKRFRSLSVLKKGTPKTATVPPVPPLPTNIPSLSSAKSKSPSAPLKKSKKPTPLYILSPHTPF